MRDPLDFFLHEKLAADEAPAPESDHVTKNPDPHSLDPGERAWAAISTSAIGGLGGGALLQLIGHRALEFAGEAGSIKWPNTLAAQNVSSISDAFHHTESPAQKVLGLFNITGRSRTVDTVDAARDFEKGIEKMKEIRSTVDSFIDKHQLAEKGVTMNFRQSLMPGARSGYEISNRRVHLPRVSKEIALHELGHAADFTGSTLGKLRSWGGPALQRTVAAALPIALIAGDRIKEMIPGSVDDKAISFMQDHAPAIMGATLAATSLYPEAKASYLAVKHIAESEGPAAARQALKKLAPLWGTYVLGAIPMVVGMSLARKYMREARKEKDDLFKGAGWVGDIGKQIKYDVTNAARDVAHAGKQIGEQTATMLKEPGLFRRIHSAAKEVGTSPPFIYGALTAAVPAAMASLYLYGTDSGQHIRNRMHQEERDRHSTAGHSVPLLSRTNESWREKHPLRFTGLAAMGAALSAGIMTKLWSDLRMVT